MNLKYILAALGCCGAFLAAQGQDAPSQAPDTVAVIENPGRVYVTQADGRTRIVVYDHQGLRQGVYDYCVAPGDSTAVAALPGDDWNIDVPFITGPRLKRLTDLDYPEPAGARSPWWVLALKGWFGGVILPTGGVSDAMNAGWEFGVTQFLGAEYQPVRRGPRLCLSLGWAYRWYNLDGHHAFLRLPDSHVAAITPLAEGHPKSSARFDTQSILVDLFVTQRLGSSRLQAGVGALMDINYYTSGWTRTTVPGGGDVSHRTIYRGLRQRKVRVDLMATLGLSGSVGVYCRWAPMSVFSAPNGPQFHQWAVGVILGF